MKNQMSHMFPVKFSEQKHNGETYFAVHMGNLILR